MLHLLCLYLNILLCHSYHFVDACIHLKISFPLKLAILLWRYSFFPICFNLFKTFHLMHTKLLVGLIYKFLKFLMLLIKGLVVQGTKLFFVSLITFILHGTYNLTTLPNMILSSCNKKAFHNFINKENDLTDYQSIYVSGRGIGYWYICYP